MGGGGGGLKKTKTCKERHEAKLEYPVECQWVQTKKTSVGRVWIFSATV